MRSGLTLFFCLLLWPSVSAGLDFSRGHQAMGEQAHAGFGTMNDLAGIHVELANPIGSIYLMLGGHLRGLGVDSWEDGQAAGFVGGFRFFSGGNGLRSSWYVTGFGGTLGVERQRESGSRIGYQRLGWGGGLGYQHLTGRARLGFTLGVSRLEPVDTLDGDRIDREYVPTLETTLGIRF